MMPAKKIFYSFLMAFSILSLVACSSASPDVTKNEVAKEDVAKEERKSQMKYIQPTGLMKGKQDQNIGVT